MLEKNLKLFGISRVNVVTIVKCVRQNLRERNCH